MINSKEVVLCQCEFGSLPHCGSSQGADEVSAQGINIKALVDDLEKNFPGIKERICDETGKIRRFVNVYVNGDDIRFLQNLETTIKRGG